MEIKQTISQKLGEKKFVQCPSKIEGIKLIINWGQNRWQAINYVQCLSKVEDRIG